MAFDIHCAPSEKLVSPFRKASKKNSRMIISLVGESQSGKTFSALRIAMGITNNDPSKIFVIDSEGRADSYVDLIGEFNISIVPEYNESRGRGKYHPLGYIELIEAAKAAGAKVVIVDSMSHAWESEGGCLDLSDNQFYNSGKKMAGMDKWKEPKRLWKKLIQSILDCNTAILTFKAQRVIELDEDGKPKKDEVLKIIRESKAPFDLDIELLMDSNTKMPVEFMKVQEDMGWLFPLGTHLTEEVGKNILGWRSARSTEMVIAEGQAAADKAAWGKSLPIAEQQIAKRNWQEIHKAKGATNEEK